MAKSGNVVPTITKAEHIGPDDTGDNIEAKRVAAYVWDGVSAWTRMTQPGGSSSGGAIVDGVDSTLKATVTASHTLKVDEQDDEIARILNSYDVRYVFKDDFSKGFQGWQYQYDSTGRTGLTLTEEARKGNYALLLHSRKAASDEAWARKGHRLPDGATKVIFGGYWSFHAVNANNPSALSFDFDMQTGSGTARYYFALRYLNHDGSSLLTKWQVNTGTATSQSYTDVTSGTEGIPWNEQAKPMLNYVVVVLDLANKKYDKLYSNGNTYDLSGMSGPTASTSLSNFDKGLVNIYRVINRANSSEEGLLTLERTFMGFVY